MSRVETGNRVAGADVVIGLFAALGLEAGERDRLANLARAAYAGTAPGGVEAGGWCKQGCGWRRGRGARVVR